MSRLAGISPALRQGNMTLLNGSLARPALRWAKEPKSGWARLVGGATATVINSFRAMETTEFDTIIRSNAAGAGNVSPLAFARANATTADGQETAIDGYEGAARVGRMALYRQTSTKYGWRVYGSTSAVLSATPDLSVTADGLVTARGGLVGTSLNVGSGGITGGAINGTSLNVGTGSITGGGITGTSLNTGGGTITVGPISASGNITSTGSIAATTGLSGASLNVGAGTVAGGAHTGTTATFSGNLSAAAITGSSLNVGAGSITGGSISGTGLALSGAASGTTLVLNGAGTALNITGGNVVVNGSITGTSVSASGTGAVGGWSASFATSLSCGTASVTSSGANALIVTGGASIGGAIGVAGAVNAGAGASISGGNLTMQDGRTINFGPSEVLKMDLGSGYSVQTAADHFVMTTRRHFSLHNMSAAATDYSVNFDTQTHDVTFQGMIYSKITMAPDAGGNAFWVSPSPTLATAATGGGSSALPANPWAYMKVKIAGVDARIPVYLG